MNFEKLIREIKSLSDENRAELYRRLLEDLDEQVENSDPLNKVVFISGVPRKPSAAKEYFRIMYPILTDRYIIAILNHIADMGYLKCRGPNTKKKLYQFNLAGFSWMAQDPNLVLGRKVNVVQPADFDTAISRIK